MNKKAFIHFIVLSIIGAIIFMIVYSIWINPNTIRNTIGDIKSSASVDIKISEDSSLLNCENDLKQCEDIFESKFNQASLKIINIEKFDNMQDANDFYNSYSLLSGGLRTMLMTEREEVSPDYPLILVAVKISYGGESMPSVALCRNDGLIKVSKATLMC